MTDADYEPSQKVTVVKQLLQNKMKMAMEMGMGMRAGMGKWLRGRRRSRMSLWSTD